MKPLFKVNSYLKYCFLGIATFQKSEYLCSKNDETNWGWGASNFYNGYYLSKVFDTNSGPEIYDNEVTRSGQPHYYKYNLEYSVISR